MLSVEAVSISALVLKAHFVRRTGLDGDKYLSPANNQVLIHQIFPGFIFKTCAFNMFLSQKLEEIKRI